MNTKSFYVNSIESLWTTLDNLLNTTIDANLGVVFCSPIFDIEKISSIFKNFNIDIIGCSTAGEIIDSELKEETISVVLFDINKSLYKILLEKNESGIKAVGSKIRAQADNLYENPAIFALSAGILNDGEEIVEGLKDGKTKEIPIFGGLSGDDLRLKETSTFTNEQLITNGIAAIVFDGDRIEINGLATSGWQSLGAEHVVTKAIGNTIYTINDEPALDYFIKFFGNYDDGTINNKPISTISAQYPFQVKKEGGHTVLRSPLNSDEEARTLTLLGRIEEGTEFRFSISPGVDVINETADLFEQFRNDKARDVDALILVSCKGRHAALGPFIEDEISKIYDFWQKPMIGFLSYGEIGNLKNGICEFHNETCCLITFKEKTK